MWFTSHTWSIWFVLSPLNSPWRAFILVFFWKGHSFISESIRIFFFSFLVDFWQSFGQSMTNFNEKNWENLKHFKTKCEIQSFFSFLTGFSKYSFKPVKSQDWIDLTKCIYVFEQSQALTTIRNVSSLFLVLWNGVKGLPGQLWLFFRSREWKTNLTWALHSHKIHSILCTLAS